MDNFVNMTDGHARHELLPFEEDIVASFPAMFARSLSSSQTATDNYFVQSFFRLARQSTVANIFLNFSASTSTLLVGKILRDCGYRIYAPYPAFDNLINLLKWLQVELIPYPEDIEALLSLCDGIKSEKSAVWIFIPNNPTGNIITENQFKLLVQTAQRKHVTLVFDFCFRFFSSEITSFDQYSYLRDSQLKFFSIEDTGKTWNTSDTKVSAVCCSDHYKQALFEAHDNLLLNISPFHLLYLGKILEQTNNHGLETVIWKRFIAKRKLLTLSMHHLPFEDHSKSSSVPLIWLKETQVGAAKSFFKQSAINGIHVLPGDQFFWNDPAKGQGFIRLPTARPDFLLNRVAASFRQFHLGQA